MDAMISAVEMLLEPPSTEIKGALVGALKGKGVPTEFAERLGEGLSTSLDRSYGRARFSTLGQTVAPPNESKRAFDPNSPSFSDFLSDAQRDLTDRLEPFLAVLAQAQEKIDRCYVRLNLLGTTDEVNNAMRRLRRHFEDFGIEGGLALAASGAEEKSKQAEKWRKDWSNLAAACQSDLAETMD